MTELQSHTTEDLVDPLPALERAVAERPNDAKALIALANHYWLIGAGPEAVGDLASRAIAAEPDNRAGWHLWALAESNPRERVARWQQVSTRFPQDLLAKANLADNAAKHTRSGRIVLRAYTVGRNVRVEVEDTGVGMSAETQRHVFDRFYRGRDRDAEGFGLGLAIVRQAVRSLGGRVELDSAPGKGTLVRIELDRVRVRQEVPA